MALVKLGKQVVRYEKKRGHDVYKLKDGIRVPGVTTISGIGEDKEGLIAWANQKGLEGLDYRAVRDEAGDVGSLAHFIIAAHLEGNDTDLSEASPHVLDLAENAVIKFMDMWDKHKLTFVSAEVPLVSEKYRYGGKRDILARDEYDRLWLIDNKTGSMLHRPMYIQLSAYENLHNEIEEEKIQRRAIFRIGKKEKGDCQYKALEDEDMRLCFNAFLTQRKLYDDLRAIKRI